MNYIKITLFAASIGILSFLFGYKYNNFNQNCIDKNIFLQMVEQESLSTIRISLSVLNDIENNTLNNSEKRLQAFLDNSLSGFGALSNTNDYILSSEAIEAIQQAKKYINNSKSYRTVPGLANSVKIALDLIEEIED